MMIILMSLVYFLNKKLDVFSKFIEFKGVVKDMSSYIIKTFCIDRKREGL